MASVTLVADAGKAAPTSREAVLDKSGGGGQGTTTTPGLLLATRTTALVESVKRVLARHNIGRNTVEIVLPQGDVPRGAVGSLEEAAIGGAGSGFDGVRGALVSAGDSRSAHDEAERGQVGAGGGGQESGGKSHGAHSHHAHGYGQCSGHGHSHAHAASVDLV